MVINHLLRIWSKIIEHNRRLTVGLGNALQFVLLADGVAVGGALGSIDQLVGQALGNRLDVAEGSLAGALRQQGDGNVDASEGRNVDGLAAGGTTGTDAGRVFTGTSIDNGINDNLDRVGIGQQVDDLEGLVDDAVGQQLLAVVAATHHHRVRQTLDDRALGLLETLGGVTSGSVREVDFASHLDVILERHIVTLDVLRGPFAEKFDFGGRADYIMLDGNRSKNGDQRVCGRIVDGWKG